MVNLDPGMTTVIMFGGILVGILLGYPLAIVLAGVATFVGLATLGLLPAMEMFRLRTLDILSNYILLAAPLFIFMGMMVERSGAAERLYSGLYLWFGGFRGGLAIASVLLGTILAATVGVIAASVIAIGIIAVPSMLKRGYNKELITGSVCAGGTLGILIPPSIMLVFYGPMAQLSVGKLFMGAFPAGFVLSALYIGYIAIRCWLSPSLAPPISGDERRVRLTKKVGILLTSMVPPVVLILAVLGSIFFGIAAPTEAAAVGALASMLLAAAYRRLNLRSLKEATFGTVRITAMAFLIAVGASMFTSVFLRLGGGDVVTNLLLATPGGRWGVFALIMFLLLILGMFIDWLGILFIMVPIATPIAATLGFNPLWFALMVCINLQMSFLTPPFAYAIFYLKGISQPEWGITTAHIVRGVIPFVLLIMVGLGLFTVFPQLILWLPAQMIR